MVIMPSNINKMGEDGNSYDMLLRYASGTEAQITFDSGLTTVQIDESTRRDLQQVKIIYIDREGRIDGKNYFVEPMEQNMSNGTRLTTKDFYQNLAKQNMPLTKGFFEQKSLASLPTNYIGYIDINSKGECRRAYDSKFKKKYIDYCQKKDSFEKTQNLDEVQASFIAQLKSNVAPVHINKDNEKNLTQEDILKNLKKEKER